MPLSKLTDEDYDEIFDAVLAEAENFNIDGNTHFICLCLEGKNMIIFLNPDSYVNGLLYWEKPIVQHNWPIKNTSIAFHTCKKMTVAE